MQLKQYRRTSSKPHFWGNVPVETKRKIVDEFILARQLDLRSSGLKILLSITDKYTTPKVNWNSKNPLISMIEDQWLEKLGHEEKTKNFIAELKGVIGRFEKVDESAKTTKTEVVPADNVVVTEQTEQVEMSPKAKRKAFGAIHKLAMERAGLSLPVVAAHCQHLPYMEDNRIRKPISASTVSQITTGMMIPSVKYLQKWVPLVKLSWNEWSKMFKLIENRRPLFEQYAPELLVPWADPVEQVEQVQQVEAAQEIRLEEENPELVETVDAALTADAEVEELTQEQLDQLADTAPAVPAERPKLKIAVLGELDHAAMKFRAERKFGGHDIQFLDTDKNDHTKGGRFDRCVVLNRISHSASTTFFKTSGKVDQLVINGSLVRSIRGLKVWISLYEQGLAA